MKNDKVIEEEDFNHLQISIPDTMMVIPLSRLVESYFQESSDAFQMKLSWSSDETQMKLKWGNRFVTNYLTAKTATVSRVTNDLAKR